MMEKECPYCGRYVYCNNAEGCPCADYEKWLENEEKITREGLCQK